MLQRPLLGAAVVAALTASPATAQHPVPADHPRVRQMLAYLERTEARTLDDQVAVCEVPAPPFKEAERAAWYRERLAALGLVGARIDAEGNVIARRPGSDPGAPSVVVSGHLDTVFPEGTDVTVKREGTTLTGPGIGDDCRGLAVVLAVARALEANDVATRGDVYFVGTVGEEGAGNLRGVRHLFTTSLRDSVDYFISVDGAGLDLVRAGVGSHRYRVTYRGPGGHSYGAFGMPSPIHALGRAIAKISDFDVPADPRTTFNVGIVEGGTSVNSIAYEASMDVDMRSEDVAALQALDARFQQAIRDALEEERARWPESRAELALVVDTIGIRPAGSQPESAPIVRAGLEAARALGIAPRTFASSTDANLPISLGVPAVTIDGGGSGRGAHSLAESYDTTDSHLGTQ